VAAEAAEQERQERQRAALANIPYESYLRHKAAAGVVVTGAEGGGAKLNGVYIRIPAVTS